jgi:hypothetical protein
MDPTPETPQHIRYADESFSRPETSRPSLHRNASNSSLSIHSVHSRVAAPEAVLPIAYRTLSVFETPLRQFRFSANNANNSSYNLDEGLHKEPGAIASKKEADQIRGMVSLISLPTYSLG